MPTQNIPVQTGQPVQSGSDNSRTVGNVVSQQAHTLANSTFDYPPPSLQEGAVNSHEVSCISLGTMENMIDYTKRLCPLPSHSRKNCHYYKMKPLAVNKIDSETW